jgi:hypothetical protein
LPSGEVESDVQEEYWTDIRKRPGDAHLTTFRSLGGQREAVEPVSVR